MSSPRRRSTRQSASNTPTTPQNVSEHNATAGASRGGAKVMLISQSTPTHAGKRARNSDTHTPQRKAARLAEATPKSNLKSSRGARVRGKTSRNRVDAEDEESSSDNVSSEDDLLASVKKNASTIPGSSFVHQNAFDAYFAASTKPSHTSNNVFSKLVTPLSLEEHATLLRSYDATSKNALDLAQVLKAHEIFFPRYALELSEGFNLLFFGFGSKRTLLNKFARTVCAPRGHVVIVDAFRPRVGIREMLERIEEVPGLTDLPLTQSGPDGQARRVYEFFVPPGARPNSPTSPFPLFLVVHNIDAPAMRSLRVKAALSLLAMNPRIHLVASIDHAHAQTLWSTAEASTRKHVYVEGGSDEVPPTRGFAWVWHDLTTMQPYDAELAHIDVTQVSGKSGKASEAKTERVVTETAAQHILASVNEKAKKLFALLARTQLAALEESVQSSQHSKAISYSALFNAARADFIAMNDTSLKALLAEFRDHNLVVSSVGSAGEMLVIPLREEELRRLVQGLSTES